MCHFFQFLPLPFHIAFLDVENVGLIAIIWRCYLWHSLWLLKLNWLISEFRKIQLQVCRCLVTQSSSALEDWRLWWRKWQWIRSVRYWGRQGAGIWKAWGEEEKRAVPSLWKKFKGSKICFPQLGLDEMFLNCRAIGQHWKQKLCIFVCFTLKGLEGEKFHSLIYLCIYLCWWPDATI